MAEESSDNSVTVPNGTRRVTQLVSGVGDAEGLGECDALGMGNGVIFRCASSRTIRIVTASPTARANNRTLASKGCNQRAVPRLAGIQTGGLAETSAPASR
jgi:hypothetical protein